MEWNDERATPSDLERWLRQCQEELQASPDDPQLNQRAGHLLLIQGRAAEAERHYLNAIRSSPSNGDGWYGLGLAERAVGKLAAARASLERAIELGSIGRRPGEAHVALADVLRGLGEFRTAIERASAGLERSRDPRTKSRLHTLIGQSYGDLRDGDEQLQHYLEAEEADPGLAEAQYFIGEAYARRCEFDLALAHLQRAVALQPELPHSWYTLGWVANRLDDYETARRALERRLELGPDDAQIRAELASALMSLEDPHAALQEARRGLRLAGSPALCASLHQIAGDCYQLLGDPAFAREQYEQAEALAPNDARVQYLLGDLHSQADEFDAALPYLKRAVALAPDLPPMWRGLAFAAEQAGEDGTAREALERLIALEPEDGPIRWSLATTLYRLNRVEAAVEAGGEALARTPRPESRAEMHSILALWEAESENARDALSHIELALRDGSSSALARYYVGLAYGELGDVELGIQHLRQACNLDPDEPQYRLGLAQVLLDSGRSEEAEALAQNLRDHDEDGSVAIVLVQCALRNGRHDAARCIAESAVDQHSDSVPAWEALAQALDSSGDTDGAAEARAKAQGLRASEAERKAERATVPLTEN